MKNSNKKGFTIVELVIVIAAIAILAAVLIPTFSSLTKRANLSADKQAVREMNMALKAAEAKEGKPTTVEDAMRIIAAAGYNTKNWACLTAGYTVFWDKEENRCVLCNATSEIEYPEDYDPKAMTASGASERFSPYNANYEAAINRDFSLSNSSTTKYNDKTSLDSATGMTDTGKTALSNATGTTGSANLKNALGITGNVYIHASNTVYGSSKSNGSKSYASMDIVSASSNEKPNLSSSGDIIPNVYVISVKTVDDASDSEKAAARKEAGTLVYSTFVQMNEGKIPDSASIVIASGTELDLSVQEWQAVKAFGGYFGTSDGTPVVIDGLKLTTSTKYSQTYAMKGKDSKYFFTGFIGVLYGKATVENLTFKNINIQEPASDYTPDYAKGQNSRNTVGIIGGIIPDPSGKENSVDVLINNITVDNSCSIVGHSTVGGIVGYIGAEVNADMENSSVTIKNCNVAASIESKDSIGAVAQYAQVGGIVGYIARCGGLNLTIEDCEVTAKMKGYYAVGGIIGSVDKTITINVKGNTKINATIVSAGNSANNLAKDEANKELKDRSVLGIYIGTLQGGCGNNSVVLNVDSSVTKNVTGTDKEIGNPNGKLKTN